MEKNRYPVSAVIIVKNGQKSIESAIKSILWCNDIIIVDDFSTDNTIAIAKKYTRRIYRHALSNDFAQQRNFGMRKAKYEWVLYIDFDEIVPAALKWEILSVVKRAEINTAVLAMRRKDYFLLHPFVRGPIPRAYHNRILNKELSYWTNPFLERVVYNGKITYLHNRLIHNRTEGISEYVKKVDFYSSISAGMLYRDGKKTNCIIMMFDPLLGFLKRCIFSLSFLDGMHALIFWTLIAYLQFLVQAKLWFMWHNNRRYL